MSLAAFQSNLALMVTDPGFRSRVRAEGAGALTGELTGLERERLLAAAVDRGLDATRVVHKGFRLSKLLVTLPLTTTLLGPRRMSREVSEFWSGRPPVSFYYVEEGLAFCEYLRRRMAGGMKVSYLAEVLAFEGAALELERSRLLGEVEAEIEVAFRHDPAGLLGPLALGRRPRRVPASKCTLVGRVGRGGKVRWDGQRRRKKPGV